MPKLAIAVTAAIGVAAIALQFPVQVLNATASLSQMTGKALPIANAVLCQGMCWRGCGYSLLVLGFRRSCWDWLPYGRACLPGFELRSKRCNPILL